MSDLTPKQAQSVEEFLIDFNATQAATRAGYSTKTAKEQGHRLLTKKLPHLKLSWPTTRVPREGGPIRSNR